MAESNAASLLGLPRLHGLEVAGLAQVAGCAEPSLRHDTGLTIMLELRQGPRVVDAQVRGAPLPCEDRVGRLHWLHCLRGLFGLHGLHGLHRGGHCEESGVSGDAVRLLL